MVYRNIKIKFTYIYTVIFIIGCYILLPIMNYDYLFALQEHSLWVKGHTFMVETVNSHGGWLAYIGAYLTQYFYYPWLGSTILVVFWLLIYFFILKITALKDSLSFIPYLFCSYFPFQILSLGYWIYYSKQPGFAFEPTIVFFALTLVCFIVSLFVKTSKKTLHIRSIVTFFALFLFLILTDKMLGRHDGFTTTVNDRNFRTELRMYRATEECRWQDVINDAPKQNDKGHVHPTNLMIMLRNIALLHTDGLMDNTFDYDNCGVKPETDKDLKVKLATQAGPLLYYHYGLINYAYRWAIENSVKYYPTVDNMKMLVRCSIFNHEFDVAMKYITILKCTTFYRKWALEQEAKILDSRLFMESDEYKCISPLVFDEDELDEDQGDVEQYILDYYSNYVPKDQEKEELSIVSSLLLQHEEEFMIHFLNFTIRRSDMPASRAMQEAAYLLGPTELSPVDISKYQFDVQVKTSFTAFNEAYHDYKSQGLDEKEIADRMLPQFGTTYWWYYYFNPELKFY